MKAIRLIGSKNLVEKEVEIPKVEKDGVLVKVKAAGICHTDYNFNEGILKPEYFGGKYPITLGHEISGDVAEIGESVTSVKPGDFVYVNYGIFCGRCRCCCTGRDNICVNRRMLGFSIDGGFADYIYVPSSASIVKMARNVPYEDAAVLGCAGVTAFHSVRKAEVGPNSILAVNGCGGVGLLAIQVAKLYSATVIAIDTRDKALTAAKQKGADFSINPKVVDAAKEVFKETGGRGVDAVLEFATTDESYAAALAMLGKGGRLVVIGSGTGIFKTTSAPMIALEAEVMGVAGGAAKDYMDVAKLASEGKLRPLITRVGKLDLSELTDVFEAMKRGEILGRAVMKA